MDLQEFQRLKAKVEESRRRGDKAAGAMESIARRLKDEFGCPSVEAAEARLEELEEAEKDAAKAAEDAMREFTKKYGERLE